MSFFRFCNLPLEVRTLIYEEYFPRICLQARSPITDPPLLHRGCPPLLLVRRSIRQEALRVFAQSIEYVTVNSSGPCRIPPTYLTHVNEVFLPYQYSTLPDKRTIPDLQTVYIWLYLDVLEEIVCGPDREEVCKDIVAKVRNKYEGSYRHTEVEKRRSERALPFKVLLEPDGLLCCSEPNYDRDEFGPVWEGEVIDWEKKEIVEGWPPPEWKSEDE